MRRAAILAVLLAWLALPVGAGAHSYPGCRPIRQEEQRQHPDWYPTGVQGCIVYGTGTASHWGGPGVARNDCLWPWDACTAIRIQSLQTGLTITVQPTMYGDLYLGDQDRSNDRMVDLDPAAVAALGLEWSDGLYPVRVTPANALPDTAMR